MARGWRGRGRGRGRGGRGRGGRRNSSQEGSQQGGYGYSQVPNTPLDQQGNPQINASSFAEMRAAHCTEQCPGWSRYFPSEIFADDFPYLPQVANLRSYFKTQAAGLLQEHPERAIPAHVDFLELASAAVFANTSQSSQIGGGGGHANSTTSAGATPSSSAARSSIAADIREQPAIVLTCMGLAMYQALYDVYASEHDLVEPLPDTTELLPYVTIRLINYEPITQLKSLKASCIGRYISLKGTVVRVGNVKPLVTSMSFECNKCKDVQTVALPDGKYFPPVGCLSDGCRSKSFAPIRKAEGTETIDYQRIRVQEIIESGLHESGRIPRTLECELVRDLVDSCVPGDVVMINGEIKVASTEEGFGKGKKKDQAMFLQYLSVNSVTGPRTKTKSQAEQDQEQQDGDGNGGTDLIEFTLKDLYGIQQVQEEKDVLNTLVNSLCPAIFGHELVKAGLLLGLFGGRQKFANDKNRIPVRGDPHILVVGDPGLGKSQMLHAVSAVCPRGVYVCGNTTTTAGLTVTLHKDGPSGDYALEAGALVLADQGCCCIDEFDKMGQQHNALLEAMEQQCISLAKAGIVCSLPSRTSIIAAANPVGGHYNKGRTVSENLKMNTALLSRFDLIFILMDKADEGMDRLLSAHVMALHGVGGSRAARTRSVGGGGGGGGGLRGAFDTTQAAIAATQATQLATQLGGDRHQNGDGDGLPQQSLDERLQLSNPAAFEPLPGMLLRKYIGYARKYVHPKVGPEAAAVLQTFYLELRQKHRSPDSTPITTRQIESLVRLSEARARLELREEVTVEDAHDVVEIMQCSMIDTVSDEFGVLDFDRSQHGSGMSKKATAKKFISELNRLSEETYNSMFTVQQLKKIAGELNLSCGNFTDFVGSLNNQGYLLQKGSKTYQLMTSAC